MEYIKIILETAFLFTSVVAFSLPPSQVASQGTGNDRIMLQQHHQKTFFATEKEDTQRTVVLKRVKKKMEKSCEHRLS